MRMRAWWKFVMTAALLGCPAAASASQITFDFVVDVTSVDGVVASAFPGFGAGGVFSGRYTFDTGTADSNANAQFGRFDFVAPGLTTAASIDIQGKTLRWTGSRIDTFNGAVDFYRVQNLGIFQDDPLVGAATFLANLVGPSSIFSSTAQPTTPPDVSLFTSINAFSVFIETQEGDGNIFGTVRSFNAASPVTAVPEPVSLVLFGSGLTLLAARRRRRE